MVKGAADNYSRKDIDKMTEVAKQYGAKGLAWVKVVDGELNGPVAKFLTGIQAELTTALALEDKDWFSLWQIRLKWPMQRSVPFVDVLPKSLV